MPDTRTTASPPGRASRHRRKSALKPLTSMPTQSRPSRSRAPSRSWSWVPSRSFHGVHPPKTAAPQGWAAAFGSLKSAR